MEFTCLKKLLRLFHLRTGITFETKERHFYAKAVSFMERAKILECEELYTKFLSDEELFLLFVDELSVSQSYFFREDAHFHLLPSLVRYPAPRILSAPCANGEEPYSIAIELFRKGFEAFHIDAVDLSPGAIKRAKVGIYGQRALMGVPEDILRNFFEKENHEYRIKEFVRQRIDFHVANIFDLEGREKYDVIFCRNFFIYLDDEYKRKALRIFYDLLVEDGYLVVSFSDYFKEFEGFDKITVDNKEIYQKKSI